MLMRAAHRGDPPVPPRHLSKPELDRHFSEFVTSRQRSLVAFARIVCRDPDEAEDVVQSALAKAYLHWRRMASDVADVEAYVRRIIVNENISRWRRVWRRREQLTSAPPEGRVEPAESDLTTFAAVRSLADGQRAVIALRFFEDLSIRQTAEILGCSEGTVKSQTARALAHLRVALAVLPSGPGSPPVPAATPPHVLTQEPR
jgi:RNA polymerase sigma-70 factor (sigma-E family)